MKPAVISLLLALLAVFDNSLFAGSRQNELENGVLTLYAGEYHATFSYGHHWNLSSLTYADAPIISAGGANQFNVKMRDANDGSLWYGGIAQPEKVADVTLYIDDIPHPLAAAEPGRNQVFTLGERYTVEKVSRVGPYQITLRTTVDSEGVSEELVFSSAAPTENVAFLYPSRFSFSSDFTLWFAQMTDGFEEEGGFGKASSISINRMTTHLALYDPKSRRVALLSTHEESPSEDGSHFIWHNKSRLHFHSKRPAVHETDGTITIRRHLSAFPVEGESWQEQARQKME